MDNKPQSFKVILVGPQGVGKSSILNRLIDTKFQAAYLSTVGVDFKTYQVNVSDKMYALQIWDTAGQQKFRALTANYFKGANGCVCVFDLGDSQSLDKCEYYIEKAVSQGISNECIVVLGNKSDLTQQNKQLGQKFAEKFGAKYRSVSAKEGKNINQVFNNLAASLVQKGQFVTDLSMKLRPTVVIQQDREGCKC